MRHFLLPNHHRECVHYQRFHTLLFLAIARAWDLGSVFLWYACQFKAKFTNTLHISLRWAILCLKPCKGWNLWSPYRFIEHKCTRVFILFFFVCFFNCSQVSLCTDISNVIQTFLLDYFVILDIKLLKNSPQ